MKLLKVFVIVSFLSACGKNSNPQQIPQNLGDTQEIVYQESTDDFANPERGFYRTAETRSSNFQSLDENELKNFRTGQKIPGKQYLVFSSLLYRGYVLDNFKDKPLSQDFLNKMNADFEIARKAGVKLILRYSYTSETDGGCPEGICPPYGDAPKPIVLEHINQLKPLVQQNSDVIAVMQEGFIGIWGEGYYSDYFGDPSSNGNGKLLDQNWNDRNEVIKTLLDALPESRMLQVRYPQIKQRFIYGINAGVSALPLTENEAYQNTDKARISFHNDAFLSDKSEMGTFIDYGNSGSGRNETDGTIETLKGYSKSEGAFLAIGGETDDPDNPSICDCTVSGGQAENEMKDFHYSFLNAEYHPDVIGKWYDHGCLDSIKKKLGYRFVLKKSIFPRKISGNAKLTFQLDLINEGYAAPFNPRPVQLIFKSTNQGDIVTLPLDIDIRKWHSGDIHLNQSLSLPSNITAGKYDLYLNIPDNSDTLNKIPEYSIRLANVDTWDANTGYNKLNAIIQVE